MYFKSHSSTSLGLELKYFSNLNIAIILLLTGLQNNLLGIMCPICRCLHKESFQFFYLCLDPTGKKN